MGSSEFWKLGAVAQRNLVASGDVSARDMVASNVARMAARNDAMNAVVDDLSEQAMVEAARLDDAFAASGPVGPLHGVTVTIKENIDQADRPTPNGIKALANVNAPADSPFVSNLKNAGAVVIGRTNTPEFSFRGTTDNPLHGRTFNPWNDWASAGGSSGGASSAVMSGIGALSHGNDIGGSLRYPAAATGAATVKPGLGRTPAYNPSQTSERGLLAQCMSVQGLICREVADVRLGMQSAIAYSPQDPWHVPMPWQGPDIEEPIKIGFTRETYGFEMHPVVERALITARDALDDAGYVVEEIEVPNIWEIGRDAQHTLFGEVKAMLHPMMLEMGSPEFIKFFDTCFEIARPYQGDELLQAYGRRSMHTRKWTTFLADYPLVLTPFMLQPTYAHLRDYEGREGAEEIMLKGFYSIAMNLMGLPAGNIPASYNDGMPVGVQIVGQRFREDLILDACEAIEARVGVMAERLFARE